MFTPLAAHNAVPPPVKGDRQPNWPVFFVFKDISQALLKPSFLGFIEMASTRPVRCQPLPVDLTDFVERLRTAKYVSISYYLSVIFARRILGSEGLFLRGARLDVVFDCI